MAFNPNGFNFFNQSIPPAFRKDDTPLNRTPGGLMEQINASLQRGRLAEGFCEAVG
jgi:hypothetical protein